MNKLVGQGESRSALTLGGELGRYPYSAGCVRLEFQIGARLIWVECRSDEVQNCVKRAERMLGVAFEDFTAAIALAESSSRSMFPEFWAAHDQFGLRCNPLDVWGVTLTPDQGTISYDVSHNWNFDFAALGVDSNDIEDHHIYIDRSAAGDLKVKIV